ncbi:hypothetical protein ABZ128_10105 [Streptomyces sp. NPDC006326]|uniref:hypothetical protein n=1 Tax=Streptomyces sp. NPDC006326 TaxID=3156752 RepID=UPI0033A3395F
MVLHNPTTGALALERPRGLPAAPYPDTAEILATPGNMTAFVLLPDGRCDILPTDPRYTFDDITWGYGGTGPDVFAQALAFAVLAHPDPERPLTLFDRPEPTRTAMLKITEDTSQHDPFRISAATLRARAASTSS